MPTPNNKTLEGMVEDALVAVLTDAGLGNVATFYTGHESEQREGAQIHVTCFGGPEIVYNSGNYLERVRITVKSRADLNPALSADDPRAQHQLIVQGVRAALHVSGIEGTLSGKESTFTCNLFYPADSNASVEGRFFVTSLEFECDCVRADVS